MRDIPGFEGLYAVTSCGKVWSYITKKFLKPELLENGYHRVCLVNGGERHRFRVHTLVARTYLDNPNNYTEVNHLDGNKTNNCVNNLEWCSHSANMLHYINVLCP